jgi:hypothetical protein
MVATNPGASANQLYPVTVKAWHNYIRSTDQRMQSPLDGQWPSLWTDEVDNRRPLLQHGEVFIAPAIGRGTQNVAEGLVHHFGAVFLPHATHATLMRVLGNYDAYKDSQAAFFNLTLSQLSSEKRVTSILLRIGQNS